MYALCWCLYHICTILSHFFLPMLFFFFFFNDTATTEIYTLSLHDALPIYGNSCRLQDFFAVADGVERRRPGPNRDRKSTRLNSSHGYISYAVFCLKKKKINATN